MRMMTEEDTASVRPMVRILNRAGCSMGTIETVAAVCRFKARSRKMIEYLESVVEPTEEDILSKAEEIARTVEPTVTNIS